MRLDPGDELVVLHALPLQVVQIAGAEVLAVERAAQCAAVIRGGVAAAVARVLFKERGVGGHVEAGVALQHLAVLVLGAVVEDRVEVRGVCAELVRQFDVLGGVITEAIHAVGHCLLEEPLHAVAHLLVLRVEVPQAEQMAVGHLPTIAVIDSSAVISASAFGFCVE